MTIPEISIILPVYNGAATLREALDSIRAQTLEDWECVIADDGSDDGTNGIAREFESRDSRFRVISPGRVGLVKALNAGLAESRAPMIARMDADDLSLPERLELQRAMMLERQLDLCSCLVESFPRASVNEGMLVYEDWLNSLTSEEEILRDFFVESPFAHPSVMFRKDKVLEAGGYQDNGWPEDYDLWMRLMLKGARFGKVPRVLLRWRDFPERLSRSSSVYAVPRFKKLKAHYLRMSVLRNRSSVTIWGAGRDGRWWLNELSASGVHVTKFIDVDPKKIGRESGGVPVFAASVLREKTDGEFVLGTVGIRGSRDIIRPQLLGFGYVERKDFIFLA